MRSLMPKATCPSCGREVELAALGTDVEGRRVLSWHYDNPVSPDRKECPGSLRTPEAGQ